MNLKKRLNYVTTLLSPSFINFYLKNKQTPVADALTYVKLKKEATAFLDQYQVQTTSGEKNNVIWICWFQGIEDAPPLVRHNIETIKRLYPKQHVQIITLANLSDFITFPTFLQDKIDAGLIPYAHLSDLVRVALLTKYGGTWIDSTVYFTGTNFPGYVFDAPLFFYSNTQQQNRAIAASSWFIHSDTNHPILVLTQDLLYNYWQTHDTLDNYFMFHVFLTIACDHLTAEYAKLPRLGNVEPHLMGKVLFEQFDEQRYQEITALSSMHKLTNKFSKENQEKADTFYQYILNH